MAIRSPWGATPRTPRSRETWSPRGEAGRANGQSTAALSAATASSFTGNLRAARCVARQAGSMLSGGRSRQLPDGVGLLSGTRSQRRRLTRPPRQRPRSRSPTFVRAKPEHRSKTSPKEKLAQLASARTLVRKGGVELFLAELGPAAERGRGGAPSPGGSSVATSLPRSRWSTRTCASSSRSPSAIAAAAFPSST
jgi:hypothetical protein